ncbi:hypothetical protein [Hymenobacter norwichensis]|uniref:hypothetical protein n=1 Tax=Hymenobacter norwichensis TaxID=223903 RepID=UPI0012F71748|nr:hypothetical protein [Hymenobacter norwichensis]
MPAGVPVLCDFMVNLTDLTGTSCPEANTWALLLFIPGLLGLLLLVRHHLRHLRRRVAATMATE